MGQIEVARVKRDMSEVQEVLERTKSHLKQRRRPEGSGSADADDDMNSVVELDESLDHALEVLHDLEENVHDLCDDEADLEQVSRTCSNTSRGCWKLASVHEEPLFKAILRALVTE